LAKGLFRLLRVFPNLATMKPAPLSALILLVLFSSVMLVVGLYLIANFNRVLRHVIKKDLLRKNLVVWMAAVSLVFALIPTNPEVYHALGNTKWVRIFIIQISAVTLMMLFVFNTTTLVMKIRYIQTLSFAKRMAVILLTIIVCSMICAVPISYFAAGGSFTNLGLSLVSNFYTGCIAGFVFITISYVDLDRKRKLSEKELEVSKLQALKTKAELEVLHSKVNPHFLYNALNSIADLSVTDGRKARKMTIALADLFRFSINYSNSNFSTVREEVEMAEVYLQIEKIRFEDQLTYSISVDEELNHFLIPRFVLQPIVENAVKHGLKATGRMTQIFLEVTKNGEGLVMNVADNGPFFPEELNPGYGVKSVYDKMDLLFPDVYEIHFVNEPRKQVSIHIKKLAKNESGI
jgi:two-component system, LytTR family, sensor kinase